MKSAKIEVDFISATALDEVLEGNAERISPSGEIRLSVPDRKRTRGFGLGEIATVSIEILSHFAKDMGYAIAAAWIYEILANRARTLVFRGKTYRVTKEDLEKMLEQLDKAEEETE
jgi:hypothetical protein